MEQRKTIALAILGVVAVIAIVGLVLLFTVSQTGAGVYGGALKGRLFPYSRIQLPRHVVLEQPGFPEEKLQPDTIYAGAPLLQDALPGQRVERMPTTGSRYKRELSRIPTTLTTCMAMQFPGNVFAPLGVSDTGQIRSYEGMGRTCFRETVDGIPISRLIAKIACCTTS